MFALSINCAFRSKAKQHSGVKPDSEDRSDEGELRLRRALFAEPGNAIQLKSGMFSQQSVAGGHRHRL
jgi:hypothetical protein